MAMTGGGLVIRFALAAAAGICHPLPKDLARQNTKLPRQ